MNLVFILKFWQYIDTIKITIANLFSFASQSYWPISEGGKNLIEELCYREEKKHEEKRERERERERERDL